MCYVRFLPFLFLFFFGRKKKCPGDATLIWGETSSALNQKTCVAASALFWEPFQYVMKESCRLGMFTRPLIATFRRKALFFFFFPSPSPLPFLTTRSQSLLCKWSRLCKNKIHFGRLFTFLVIITLGSTIPSLVVGQKKWAACQVDVSMAPNPQRWCVFQLIQWRVGWTLGIN